MSVRSRGLLIITYQVITGNYSSGLTYPQSRLIITYQVITGNYSEEVLTEYEG